MPLKLKKSSKMSLLLIPRYKNTSKLLKIALVPLRLKKKNLNVLTIYRIQLMCVDY